MSSGLSSGGSALKWTEKMQAGRCRHLGGIGWAQGSWGGWATLCFTVASAQVGCIEVGHDNSLKSSMGINRMHMFVS